MFTSSDLSQLQAKGISRKQVEEQLESIRNGFPFLELDAAASLERGIHKTTVQEETALMERWNNYRHADEGAVVKFVPASGAASRMFKDLYAFLDAPYSEPATATEKKFFEHTDKFAFFESLNDACIRNEGAGVFELAGRGDFKSVVENLLLSKGLNYGSLPKGLLQFHKYSTTTRTPLEEHMVEAASYALGKDGVAHLHFTVSPEHRKLFEALVERLRPELESKYRASFSITFSEQKPCTDTIAATADFEPMRQKDGSLLFRPGGHGALIENLSDLDANVVFIKNIDNVTTDSHRSDTIRFKQIIGGYLVQLQDELFCMLQRLDTGTLSREGLISMAKRHEELCCCKNEGLETLSTERMASYLRSKLDRPIRVCGMVVNTGEPGGGPFVVKENDGTTSLQILESSQINTKDPKSRAVFEQNKYFNPVDLVCSLKNYRGEKYDLKRYVDHNTGFISSKSKDGRELKALELPGLWNGAMSNWNTAFILVPESTFSPVKTVCDLLGDYHQE